MQPIVDLHPFRLNGQPGLGATASEGQSVKLWAQDHAGGLAMQGGAELA